MTVFRLMLAAVLALVVVAPAFAGGCDGYECVRPVQVRQYQVQQYQVQPVQIQRVQVQQYKQYVPVQQVRVQRVQVQKQYVPVQQVRVQKIQRVQKVRQFQSYPRQQGGGVTVNVNQQQRRRGLFGRLLGR